MRQKSAMFLDASYALHVPNQTYHPLILPKDSVCLRPVAPATFTSSLNLSSPHHLASKLSIHRLYKPPIDESKERHHKIQSKPMSPLSSLSLLLSYSVLVSIAAAGNDSTLVYAGCSDLKYDPNSPYQSNLDSLLASFANAAAISSYSNFSSSAAPASPILGLYQCRSDLPLTDCATCVRSAISQLSTLCPSSAAATLQLRSCFLRYGNDSFLGRPDTSLAFKRCGPTATSDHSSTMSDMALSALASPAASVGPFRLGVAGQVCGAAQCVGDLSPEDCGACLAEAVGRLRSECGEAESGDMYLGKCYARFWSGEGDDPSTAHRRWLHRAVWPLMCAVVASI